MISLACSYNFSVMPQLIIEARTAALSTGLNVRRILSFRMKRMVGPFIFMDHDGPVSKPKHVSDLSAMDVLPHTRTGISTVTYLHCAATHR